MGGFLSDRFGRRRTFLILLAGTACGYLALSQVTGATWLVLAMGATLLCSCFVQACSGAVIAMVPGIRHDMTGQIAGMVGAYGTTGAVAFLTVLSFVSPQAFFMVIALSAVATLVAAYFLLERTDARIVAEEGAVAVEAAAS
jgi:NNP family nitrate/nitrite transporter-like MFS transporter